ncbi:MAG: ABC transporter ATP-binding protein [Candidatus Limnocylindria bacterium]|nr:ABC transporter ATP-binding protein [Candidatus Limnocylindria bacterium]
MSALLELRNVSCRYGGLMAVDGVSFDVASGEILGLIGPNGAGKTTLMNVVSGVTRPSGGEIRLDGQRLDGRPPHVVARLGVARTFQIMRPFPGLSLRENVAIGARFGHRAGEGGMAAAFERADAALERVGLAARVAQPVSALTTADRKKLELARALAMDPRALLLDEVLGGLNPREVGEVMELVRAIGAQGIAIVLIEHVMKAVMGLCDRVVVLHHGKAIATGTPGEIAADGRVVSAYLGERYRAAGTTA